MWGYCLLTLVVLQTPNSAGSRTWLDFLDQPYSKNALVAHLNALGRETPHDFDNWYISGVYRAKQAKGAPKWIVQIYDGDKSAFRLGCLVVLGPKGKHLRTISSERVHWSLMAADADFELARTLAAEKIVVDLPDLNGDSYAELPTQRWLPVVAGKEASESTSIYQTKDDQISCLFCLEFYQHWPVGDLPFGHCYLHYDEKDKQTLILSTPVYIATGNGFTKADLPRRQLASFRWSDEMKSWVGPKEGPKQIWKVLQRK
jgi:hypothetical protein